MVPGDRAKNYFKKINIFDSLSAEDLGELGTISAMKRWPAESIIIFPGDPARSIYFLKEGRARTSVWSEDGQSLTLDYLEAGEIFGEQSLVDNASQEMVVEAVEDCLVCVVDRDDFENFLLKRPDLILRITALMGTRQSAILRRLTDLAFRGIKARVCRVLLNFSARYGVPDVDRIEIRIRLTHKEIGNLVGASREMTTIVLNELRAQGAIDYKRGKLFILDLEKIKALT